MNLILRLYLLCNICLVISGISVAQVKWEKAGFSAAVQQAIKQDKTLMIDFYTDWCLPCRELDKAFFTDDTVIVRFVNTTYVGARMNAGRGEGRILAKKYHVSSYPTVLFLDKDQNVRGRIIGLRGRDQYFEALKTAGVSEEKRIGSPAGK